MGTAFTRCSAAESLSIAYRIAHIYVQTTLSSSNLCFQFTSFLLSNSRRTTLDYTTQRPTKTKSPPYYSVEHRVVERMGNKNSANVQKTATPGRDRFDAIIDRPDLESREAFVRNHSFFSEDTYIIPQLQSFLEKIIKTRIQPPHGSWSRIWDTVTFPFLKMFSRCMGASESTTAREPGVLRWPDDMPDGRYLLARSNPPVPDGGLRVVLINEEMGLA